MENSRFWLSWTKNYRSTYILLLFVLVAVVAASFYFQANSIDNFAPLETARKTEAIDVSLKEVNGISNDLTKVFKSYVVFQTALALHTKDVSLYSYIFLIIVTICLAFLAAAATYLGRLWFAVSQGVFIVWLITLKIPYLQVLGVSNSYLEYAIILAFVAVGYVFHAIYAEVSLLKKFLAFLLLCAAIMTLIHFGGQELEPLLFVSHHMIIVPIFLAILFIANVAYDILLSIISLLADKRTPNSTSNIRHFLILSFLYLSYVTLTFLRNDFAIKWDIIYLDEFLLLFISSCFGIWGFKKRSILIKNQISFTPLGAYVYLVMAVITFITIGLLFATANDALIDTFKDAIIFSHLGFGVGFVLYILFNFYEFLKDGAPISQIIFDPKRLPVGVIRLVGLSIALLMILRMNYVPYFQAISGYYNSIAAYYDEVGKNDPAVTSYKVAKQYASTNHLSNFMLGQDFYRKKDWVKSAYYFGRATFKEPSIQAYVNRTQAQLNGGVVFEALFTLEDALNAFPKDPFLMNMKGLVFERLNQIDSAYLYFEWSHQEANNNHMLHVSLANKLALSAKNGLNDSLPREAVSDESPVPLKANFMALANAQRISLPPDFGLELPADSTLTYNDFSLLFNHLSNEAIGNNKSPLQLDSLMLKRENEPFSKSLMYALAVNDNYASFQKEAYTKVVALENADISDAGYYAMIHGLWLLDQEAFGLAIAQFSRAEKLRVNNATYFKIIALLKNKQIYEAAQTFESMKADGLADYLQLKQFFNSEVSTLSDHYKYLWYRYNPSLGANERASLLDVLQKSDYAVLIRLDAIAALLEVGKLEQAISQLLADENTLMEKSNTMRYQELLALAYTLSKDRRLEKLIEAEQLTIYPKNYRLLYQSFKVKEDNKLLADSLMFTLGFQNVFFEQGISQAVKYFNQQDDFQKAYTILVEAARLNPQNTTILKLYALQALRVNIRSYATSSLTELANQLNEDEYQLYLKEFNELKAEIDNRPW